MKLTKLWENAAPTSAFSGQTIPLDLSGFCGILIYSKTHYTANQNNSWSLNLIGTTSAIYPMWDKIIFRQITSSETKIIFGPGRSAENYNGGTSEDNIYAVPLIIYGLTKIT